ncbi:MAG: hydantoinase/oxoprolinase family protein [Pseudomonadota bacterium]
MVEPTSIRIAVDIGGTFTDVAAADAAGAIVATAKTPTTAEPAEGALAGSRAVLGKLDLGWERIAGFVHGTTLATNALIERRGARVATVTTEGFRDILEIAYERRFAQYDIDIEKPDLLVPRARAFTVPERVSADGRVLRPLDEGALDRLIGELDASGAEAVAICLLHACANPAHEQRLAERLRAARPGLAVSLSSEVSPEAREFERLSTTVANAYVQPLMDRYLAAFETRFAAEGLRCPIMMMTSGGGMTTVATARRLPIRLVESGPSGGAILAAAVARRAGLGQVLSFDMGGTTAKLCLIDGAEPQTTRSFEIARAARFIKGSGMPVRIPVVELIEIGAGGGSVAAVDGLGRLTVGPESAGAEPGPAAFARGGTEPTVTDADVVLGYIDPDRFAEGRLAIDPTLARATLERRVGAPLGLDAAGAAFGVSEIVDESMAAAARMHAVESGADLGARTMIAFGGNGPLHATRVARRAGVSRILVPPDPGVGSAIGFLAAPVSFERVRSRYTLLGAFDADRVEALLAGMTAEATAVVAAGAPGEPVETRRTAFMRYRGQGHEIEIALPDRPLSAADAADLTQRFETAYAALFSRAVPGMAVEVLNWAVRVATRPRPPAPMPAAGGTRRAVPAAHRMVACDATGDPVETAIHLRAALRPGDRVAGPALIVEPQTTTLVGRGFVAEVDGALNLVLNAGVGPTAPAERIAEEAAS